MGEKARDRDKESQNNKKAIMLIIIIQHVPKTINNSGEYGRVVQQSTCLPSATQLISLMIFLAV